MKLEVLLIVKEAIGLCCSNKPTSTKGRIRRNPERSIRKMGSSFNVFKNQSGTLSKIWE